PAAQISILRRTDRADEPQPCAQSLGRCQRRNPARDAAGGTLTVSRAPEGGADPPRDITALRAHAHGGGGRNRSRGWSSLTRRFAAPSPHWGEGWGEGGLNDSAV